MSEIIYHLPTQETRGKVALSDKEWAQQFRRRRRVE